MTRPVDWWGQTVERESRVRLERVTAGWWGRYGNIVRWATFGAGALVGLAIVVAAIVLLTAQDIAERMLAEAAHARAESFEIQEATIRRACREYPDDQWCRVRRGVKGDFRW